MKIIIHQPIGFPASRIYINVWAGSVDDALRICLSRKPPYPHSFQNGFLGGRSTSLEG